MGHSTLLFEQVRQRNEEIVAYSSQHPEVTNTGRAELEGRGSEGSHAGVPVSTGSGVVGPRVFMDDTLEDRQAIQPVLRQIMMYPVSKYDGTMKSIDWSTIPHLPNQATGDEEVKWVLPGTRSPAHCSVGASWRPRSRI
jgi:hypothetical protein